MHLFLSCYITLFFVLLQIILQANKQCLTEIEQSQGNDYIYPFFLI